MHWDDYFISPCIRYEATYTSHEDIPAFQIVKRENEVARFGRIVRLPVGARLKTCGEGFNERTLTVQYQGSFYFVFIQDLECHSSEA